MDNYELMKFSQKMDEDGIYIEDFELEELFEEDLGDPEAFKRTYKEFYTDIKLSHKEDW